MPQDFLTAFSWDVVSELYSQVILGHIAKAYHQDIWEFDKYGYNLCFNTEQASYLNPSFKCLEDPPFELKVTNTPVAL